MQYEWKLVLTFPSYLDLEEPEPSTEEEEDELVEEPPVTPYVTTQ